MDSWEGRIENTARTEMWLLSGDREGGIMEKRALSAVLCATVREGMLAAGLPPISVHGPPVEDEAASSLELAEAQPIFNSLPGANGVIYLDFDGETVSGTQWNASFTSGADIVAGASGFSNAQIQLIWETMSEDYRPFNINVTTDRSVYNSYSTNRKTMMIFTPDNEWYGAAGGVAYVDIFGSSQFDEPGWVFVDQLLFNSTPYAPYAAEAGSHEAGHVLGLSHDGTDSVDYYQGHGSGATSWGPIMGASYQVSVSHWSKGEYANADRRIFDPLIMLDVESAMWKIAAGTYVRIHFNISQAERVLGLTLRMKYDDGFAAYINGQEVALSNVPAGRSYNTTASSNRSDEAALSFQTFNIPLLPGMLVDGDNVLALHGMNSAIATNEREFVMVGELEATLKESPYLQLVSIVGNPQQEGTNDDPDGDEADNLTEHAGGTDPTVIDSYPWLRVEPEGVLRLQIPETPPDDVRYEIQEIQDLAGGVWQVVASRDGAGPWTVQQPGSTVPARAGYVDVIFAMSIYPRAFYRLRLTLITP